MKRRPRPIVSNPLWAIMPASKAERDRLMLVFHTALDAVARSAEPAREDWQTLADAVNTVETLCLVQGKLLVDEVMPTLRAASAALAESAQRYRAGGSLRLSGDGMQAMREVIDIYEQCLERLTEREMAQAQIATIERVRATQRAIERGESTAVAL